MPNTSAASKMCTDYTLRMQKKSTLPSQSCEHILKKTRDQSRMAYTVVDYIISKAAYHFSVIQCFQLFPSSERVSLDRQLL